MVLKKMYCKNCDKEFLVENDISFCPECCSILVDMGELVSVEPPKKKSKKMNNSIALNPKDGREKKFSVSEAKCLKIMAIVGAIVAITYPIIKAIVGGVDIGESIIWVLLFSPIYIAIGAGCGYVCGYMLYCILRFIEHKIKK